MIRDDHDLKPRTKLIKHKPTHTPTVMEHTHTYIQLKCAPYLHRNSDNWALNRSKIETLEGAVPP